MKVSAMTVAKYLAGLPPERKKALSVVRQVLLTHLDDGYEEGVQYGMIGYFVPHRLYPAGYHVDPAQPLPFAGLASQKNHMALYLFGLYVNAGFEKRFRADWAKTGKRLDMGKSCIRFRDTDSLALDVIGKSLKALSAKKFIKAYEASRARRTT